MEKFNHWDINSRLYEKTRCPFCERKLTKKWMGMACQTHGCPLNFKCGCGWVRVDKHSGWSKSRMVVNGMFGSKRRNYLQKKFAYIKKDVFIRDDYKCRMCDYSLADDFYFRIGLCVHHIVPASEEMALFLDVDNCITLCKKCHDENHSEDKHYFGGRNGKK